MHTKLSVIGNVVIMLFCYIDNDVLFANALGDAHNLIRALDAFCMHIKLHFNSSKMKITLAKGQRINHTLCTIMSHLKL